MERSRTRQHRIALAGILCLLLAAILGFVGYAGFFDRDADHFYAAKIGRRPLAAVLFSGDMGLRLGMGPHVARGLARSGVPVLGISSPTEFGRRRSEAEVVAAVSGAIRTALAKTGARQVLVLGQSFGADMVRVGLSSLPADLRPRVAAAVLVVPGETAYFRADPSGISYHGIPDADASGAVRIDWTPLICVRGSEETDSLCPRLGNSNVRSIVLPGDHFLHHDHRLLVHTLLTALAPILRTAAATP